MSEAAVEFDGFEWDDGNREKCLQHGVSLPEIEQAARVIRFVVDDPFPGERRYPTVGRTEAVTCRCGRLTMDGGTAYRRRVWQDEAEV